MFDLLPGFPSITASSLFNERLTPGPSASGALSILELKLSTTSSISVLLGFPLNLVLLLACVDKLHALLHLGRKVRPLLDHFEMRHTVLVRILSCVGHNQDAMLFRHLLHIWRDSKGARAVHIHHEDANLSPMWLLVGQQLVHIMCTHFACRVILGINDPPAIRHIHDRIRIACFGGRWAVTMLLCMTGVIVLAVGRPELRLCDFVLPTYIFQALPDSILIPDLVLVLFLVLILALVAHFCQWSNAKRALSSFNFEERTTALRWKIEPEVQPYSSLCQTV